MTELVLIAFLAGLVLLGFRRPFIWVLAYLYVDLVMPQKIGYVILPVVPISLIFFVLALAGWALMDDKTGTRFTFRQVLIALLLAWCAYTTMNADFPEAALTKWDWVWKTMVFAIFLPLTLRTRLRLETAALFAVLSIGAIAISGGIKTIFSGGGGYGTLVSLVDLNSGIYEGSTKSMAAIAIIPLVWWCARHSSIFPRHWAVTTFAMALILACLLIPIGTQTRTGLLCIGVLGLLVMRHARHRFALGAIAGVLGLISLPFLPASYTERMGTITTFQADTSASTRVAVWEWTLDYVKDNPLGGGFDAYLANSFTYDTRAEVNTGGVTRIERVEVTDEARAYHSAYFEMLGEQGWPGFWLWIAIHVIGLWQMERLQRALRRSDDAEDARLRALAIALQQGQIVALVGALFVGIAFQPFMFLIVSLQTGLATICARRLASVKDADRKRKLRRQRERMQAATA